RATVPATGAAAARIGGGEEYLGAVGGDGAAGGARAEAVDRAAGAEQRAPRVDVGEAERAAARFVERLGFGVQPGGAGRQPVVVRSEDEVAEVGGGAEQPCFGSGFPRGGVDRGVGAAGRPEQVDQ